MRMMWPLVCRDLLGRSREDHAWLMLAVLAGHMGEAHARAV
jgi:hypothetical protein